ncbi:hypothetical protein [Bradyrhizobium sp. Cp5.3]|uniref:hypothetical protein n=1 Tax=Bradyrhizobium sp. Cp5.3 TaxID=443598 RepID=UPI0012EB2671|nr:hypothetical protein [Bradyrhizobium sp. Cp5.3]
MPKANTTIPATIRIYSEAVHTRRNVLSAVGSAAAVAAIPAPASALHAADLDPTFAAIDEHKRAIAAYDEIVDQQDHLEDAIPEEQRRSTESQIVEGDAPEWIAFQQAMARVGTAEQDAECALADVMPTTLAGVIALLEHAQKIEAGLGFRGDLVEDENDVGHSWWWFASRNITAALLAICA